ncbi:class F sortase [Virgisporangium aurantiacum]|uniref:Class F sortase n=1 Tax=Virgisporangium aurantiacum TaxID=175570 RepID=A0A8J3ZLC0_9ACTN|nr:class F sortase [Virgisporangium aurantiacum]GIJ63576.1 class F sortase [Virgisporangium aurantiacum]
MSQPESRRVGRQGRIALLAAAVVALAVIAAVGANLRGDRTRDRGEPPAPVSASPAGSGPERTGGDALTTGPLLPTSNPVSVSIPALNVTSTVTGLGLNPDGSMQVPDNADTVGWFTHAPTPGALGPAVLAGHVNWKGHDGAFAALDTMKAGDAVNITRGDGIIATFTVTKVGHYPKDQFPSDAVYGAIDHAGLRLITCGGEFDTGRHSYRDNIVVYATLAHS